jgi:hypothetical protein
MTFTDSSKASLVFFYDPSFDTHDIKPCSLVITYLAEGRRCDFSVPFPLFKLCRQDVAPEGLENPVVLHRLGESQARAQYDLYNVILSQPAVAG